MTGADIKEIRLTLGDTRDEFAARIKAHPRTVRGWENGEYAPRNGAILDVLRRLACETHVELNE